ncbi:hypothetical protein Gotri_019470, partial [Gossypium trilobum]|nr:hypothetical protein [Gossypium trilobum]
DDFLAYLEESEQHCVLGYFLDLICFNTDGSIKIEDDFAAAGGIVRDSNGKWIFGFCRYLGCCTALDAELWGILDEEPLGGPKSTLIRRIHQFLSKVHHWHIQHVPRDENKFVDGLAKMVANHATAHTNGEQSKYESLGRQLFGEQSRELSICELSGGQLKCKNVDRLFILDELSGLSNDRVVEKVTTTLPKRYESKISSFEDSKDLSTISLLELINMLYAQE